MSEKQYRDQISRIKKAQAAEESAAGKARAAASKHRAEAAKERNKITPRTSPASVRTHEQNARRHEQQAEAEDKKASTAATKVGKLQGELATAERNLTRAISATQRREESARKTAERAATQAENRRRQTERAHAREIGRLKGTVHHVHEYRPLPPVKPEPLRVVYLTADTNLQERLRVDAEVRQVREQVRGSLHRDLIDIKHYPAATPEDLLQALNDDRPHIVHFSGHAGGAALDFDNGSVEAPDSRTVSYELLNRALGATGTPPTMVVLNGCETLDGAEALLESSAVVVATTDTITDLAASVFAARFYTAIASAQPVQAAVDQASVAVDMAGLGEGDVVAVISREDVDLTTMILVQVPHGPGA